MAEVGVLFYSPDAKAAEVLGRHLRQADYAFIHAATGGEVASLLKEASEGRTGIGVAVLDEPDDATLASTLQTRDADSEGDTLACVLVLHSPGDNRPDVFRADLALEKPVGVREIGTAIDGWFSDPREVSPPVKPVKMRVAFIGADDLTFSVVRGELEKTGYATERKKAPRDFTERDFTRFAALVLYDSRRGIVRQAKAIRKLDPEKRLPIIAMLDGEWAGPSDASELATDLEQDARELGVECVIAVLDRELAGLTAFLAGLRPQ